MWHMLTLKKLASFALFLICISPSQEKKLLWGEIALPPDTSCSRTDLTISHKITLLRQVLVAQTFQFNKE